MMGHNTTPINIIADHREKNSGVLETLRGYDSVSLSIQTFPLGDYYVDNRLLFERKTLTDFIASIKDGRIFRQGINLASSPLKGVIILEGTSGNILRSGMRREAIQGALITISLNLGIPIFRSTDPMESAKLILFAAHQIKFLETNSLPRHNLRPKGKRAVQLQILQGIPGVGRKRAQLLLKRFGSLDAIISASMEELLRVEGIGRKTVETIQWAVSESESVYYPVYKDTQ